MKIKITVEPELRGFIRTLKSSEIRGEGHAEDKDSAEEKAKKALKDQAGKKHAAGVVEYKPIFSDIHISGSHEVWYRCTAKGITVFARPKRRLLRR